MRLIFILLSVLLGTTASLLAQNRAIVGQVVDENKQPMPGTTITEVGFEKNATVTDVQGNFTLQLRGKSNQVTARTVGYLPKIATVTASNKVIIQLSPDVKGLEEVVVVGFGRQKRITSTGSVSSIKAEEIRSVPTSSIQNTLVGRLPGFFSQQTSGQPGADAAEFYIRGANSLNDDNRPLIVVDDVEYDYSQLSQLNVNEVESVSILKDAATTSIYGLKGANGVLVITTRRGRVSKPRINLSAETGLNKVIRMPQFLDAYTTALLRNEAVTNDAYGRSQASVMPFSSDNLQKFKDGSDPYGHSNVNWIDEVLNNSSTQGRYNIDISGGNNTIKYFTSLGTLSQNGILKQFEPIGNEVNTNYFYKRYNYRSNLDFTPTKTLKIRFDVNGRFEAVNNPGGVVETTEGLFYELGAYNYLAPYAMPLQNPNGTYSYSSYSGSSTTSDAIISPVYRLANGGYRRDIKNNYNIVVGADQGLGFITSGLSAKIQVSYAGNNNESRDLTRNGLPVAKYDPSTNSYVLRGTRLPVYGMSNTNDEFNSTTILTASLNHDRTFGDHHFTTLLLMNRRNYINKAEVPVNYMATTARLDYDFRRKYLLGFTIARNGSDLFQKDKRYGVFPAVSWGYNISQEKFFQKALPFIDLFKIRGSYGVVGSDANTRILGSILREANPVIQYTTGSNQYGATIVEGSLINPDITWDKERKTDLGIDANMFNGKLTVSGSYFYNYRFDQLIRQQGVPLLIGQDLPLRNLGRTQNKGFDGVITYRKSSGDFRYSLSANASHAKNKILYVSEAPNYPYQAQTGRAIKLELGYHFIGFYQMEDFDASGNLRSGIAAPRGTNVPIQPGDLRFQDFNGDGMIDDADRTYLAKPNLPTTTYGFEFTSSYKGFNVRALVQGAFDYSLRVRSVGSGDAFVGNLTPWALERWTPQTSATATYPRLGIAGNEYNTSSTISDFWYVNAGYIRLKSVDIGYQIPASWLKKVKTLQNARVFASGYNLLSINKMGKFQQDAEIASRTSGAAYPLTANFNFGVTLGF